MEIPDEQRAPQVRTSDLVAVLGRRAPRLAAGIAVGQAAWPWAGWARARVRAARTYTVRVPGNPGDALYEELHARILQKIPEGQRRALLASGTEQRRPVTDEWGNLLAARRAAAVRLRYDGSRDQQVMIGGHKVKISVTDGQSGGGSPSGGYQGYKPPEVTFTALSREARDAVLAFIEDAHQHTRSRSRKPSFWMFNQWDEWERMEEVAERTRDSVILPPGQLERIIADVGAFLDSEAEYLRRYMPWHRGYAFWGPPGTGKTSAARVIASHFGLDMWYLPLSDVKRDASLLKSVHQIKGKSVLLLEDIDVFHAATSRVGEDGKPLPPDDSGVTLSGVLNMLDGVGTPHGLIIILTSNTPEVLDEAVTRAGRADRVEEFGLSGPGEARRFLEWWYGEECPVVLPAGLRLPCSDIAECCKRSASIKDAAGTLQR